MGIIILGGIVSVATTVASWWIVQKLSEANKPKQPDSK